MHIFHYVDFRLIVAYIIETVDKFGKHLKCLCFCLLKEAQEIQ